MHSTVQICNSGLHFILDNSGLHFILEASLRWQFRMWSACSGQLEQRLDLRISRQSLTIFERGMVRWYRTDALERWPETKSLRRTRLRRRFRKWVSCSMQQARRLDSRISRQNHCLFGHRLVRWDRADALERWLAFLKPQIWIRKSSSLIDFERIPLFRRRLRIRNFCFHNSLLRIVFTEITDPCWNLSGTCLRWTAPSGILRRSETHVSVHWTFINLMNALCEFLRGKAHQYHSEEAKRNAWACHVPLKNCF